jgi:hypothetical protein
LYSYEAILARLAQGFEDVSAELRGFVPEAHALGRPRPLARQQYLADAEHAHIGDRMRRGAEGWGVTRATRASVRPATRWMRGVSRASARAIARRIVVRRRASLAVPVPSGPRSTTVRSQCRHEFPLYPCNASRLRLVPCPHFWAGRHGEGQAHPPVISAAVFTVPKGSRGLDVVLGVLDVLITRMISR